MSVRTIEDERTIERHRAVADVSLVQGDWAGPRLMRSQRPAEPTVSVVVPTLNEARNLPYALWRLPDCVTEVIVVDGRSSDDTIETALRMRADVVVVREKAKGKGAALRAGFEAATGDIVIMLDADGSADAAEIQRFVDVLVGGADFAKGSRFLPGGGSIDITRIRGLGNQSLTAIVNLICQTHYTDLCYGYNAFWRDCLEFIEVDVSGFEIETRLNMLVAASGLAVVEVPSWEFERVHGVSNLHAVRDGLRVLRTIITTAREIRSGRRSVLSESTGHLPRQGPSADPDANAAKAAGAAAPPRPSKKSMVVVPGKLSIRLADQARYLAQELAEDGRVLVVFTQGGGEEVVLPGQSGRSTLLGNAPSGYPLWTGRLTAALGVRRRQDNTIIMLFDGSNEYLGAVVALVSRLRRERVIVHRRSDPSSKGRSWPNSLVRRVVDGLGHVTISADSGPTPGETRTAVAIGADDAVFGQLIVDAIDGMSDDAAQGWKFVVQTDVPSVAGNAANTRRATDVTVETGSVCPESLMASDLVIVPSCRSEVAELATRSATPAIVVNDPVSDRMMRRVDGVWVARPDVVSLLVTIEAATGAISNDSIATQSMRSVADQIVDAVRRD